jgi:O6-methylguanine-DNA--protein-cysteine methyltransferase
MGSPKYFDLVTIGTLMHAYKIDVPALLKACPTGHKATAMQKAVWAAVHSVPQGYVGTYGSIGLAAKWILHHANRDDDVTAAPPRHPHDEDVRIGSTLYLQAVGQALRRNPVAPMVPCHRCVRQDRSIGGFCGETEGPQIARKVALLTSEGVCVTTAKKHIAIDENNTLTV